MSCRCQDLQMRKHRIPKIADVHMHQQHQACISVLYSQAQTVAAVLARCPTHQTKVYACALSMAPYSFRLLTPSSSVFAETAEGE